MANAPFSPEIGWIPAEYSKETAGEYDKKVSEEKVKIEKSDTHQTAEEIENFKISSISKIIKETIYTEALTSSPYQFTEEEIYNKTDVNDKTDTYINMNTSFRYIKYNIDGAGTLYNQLNEGNDFRTDSPQKVFASLKNRFVRLWFNQKVNEQGELETFDPKNDTDLLYMIGFFQTIIENKIQDPSKKDFRVWPLTLKALLDNNNSLEQKNTTQTNNDENLDDNNEKATDTQENLPNKTEKELKELKKEIIENTTTPPTDNTIEKDWTTQTDNAAKEAFEKDWLNQSTDTKKNTETTTNEIEQQEKIGTREFPKVKDIYEKGSEAYLFDMEDLKARWVEENMEYIPIIYQTLQLESNLGNTEDAKDLKEKLIRPRFEQLNQVIDEMKTGITINKKLYKITDNEIIKQAITTKKFNQTIMIDNKLYEVNFETRTPEMKKIERSAYPLGDKEYKTTEGKSGNLKEKYQIEEYAGGKRQGILYTWVKWLGNRQKIEDIKIGEKILYSNEK